MGFRECTLIGIAASLSVAATPQWAAAADTTASHVFAADSRSIVVVKAFDASDHVLALGSGVVIDKGVVVSNCHVFAEAQTQSASAFYGDKRFPATLRYADSDHDLCSFTVNGLDAPPVKMRDAATLKVGEDAYAIGAPEGFDLTLSSGIISSLRKLSDGNVIQMTTPISPGSSGGGLFDSEGRLIGITSYYVAKGQQLNFALPVEWIEALPQRGKTRAELASQPAKRHADYQQGIRAQLSGDYAAALNIFRPLAAHGDSGAQAALGLMYINGQGVHQDYGTAFQFFDKSAVQGFAPAQFNLAWMYLNGHAVAQDDVKAFYWYNNAAAQGIPDAQFNVGQMYDQGKGVPKDSAKALYWLRKAAAQGIATAQYNIGTMYDHGRGVPQDYDTAIRWYLKAAAQGHAAAQFNIGSMYYLGQGVPKDSAKAFYWFDKAATHGHANSQRTIGAMYDLGQGVPQNPAMAAYWYRKAAAQGDAAAQYSLALMYKQGHGVPQDYDTAFQWFDKAAAQGDAGAQNNLGLMYQLGESVPPNSVVAYALYNLGSGSGADQNAAAVNRDKLMTSMSREQIQAGQELTRQMQSVGVRKALDAYFNST